MSRTTYPRSVDSTDRADSADLRAELSAADRLRSAAVQLHSQPTESLQQQDRLRRISVELHEIAYQLEQEARPRLAIVPPVGATTGLVVDPSAVQAHIDGRRLSLTLQEFRLLTTFIENQGQALTRVQLMRLAWADTPRR